MAGSKSAGERAERAGASEIHEPQRGDIFVETPIRVDSKLRQERHREDAAPTEFGNLFWRMIYKDAAPMALKIVRGRAVGGRPALRSCHAEARRRRECASVRCSGARDGRIRDVCAPPIF